ncbi:MAG: M48 family metalloprotease [Parvularculaceae bacterium]
MKSLRQLMMAALAAVAAAALTATPSFAIGILGPSDEQARALGDQEHPKIVAAFGGEMTDPALKAYVEGITKKLMAVWPKPNEAVQVTLLDSPVINAMALPGHVYVTRGLLSLANSEAELAGVIGHELGHIYKRHTAKRIKRGNLATIGAVLVGVATKNQGLMQQAGQAAQLYLLQFSRKQEYESDLVGVRLLAASGYDPVAQAEFLDALDLYSNFEMQLSGQQRPPEFLSTHPNTADRVKKAAAEAKLAAGSGVTAAESRTPYFARIDRLLYGDDPRTQGFIRGNEFIHPALKIAFSVPSGFKLQNSSQAVVASSQNAQMQFAAANSADTPTAIIQGPLAQQLGLQFTNVRGFTSSGRQGATGYGRAQAQGGQALDVQPFVIKWAGNTNYLFLWVSAQSATQGLQSSIEQSVASLRDIDPAMVNVPPTQTIEVVTVGSGDTLSSLANRTSFADYKLERFCVLNHMRACNSVTVGAKVKLVR